MRPPDLSWAFIAAGALLAGIGFTMALFIANLAFGEEMIDAAKLGILAASVVAATAGVTSLAWLSSSSDRGSAEGFDRAAF